MPRFLTLIILILSGVSSFAQLKITTTEYDGKLYKVYPVRVPLVLDRNYSYKRNWRKKSYKAGQWNKDATVLKLPFNPFNLENGDYLIYYAKRKLTFDEKTDEPIYSHEDTTLVAVTFSIVNNKKDGKVTWYDFGEDRNILQTGQYSQDQKQGEWISYRKENKTIINYQNDIRNGSYKKYSKGKIVFEATYLNGNYNGTVTRHNEDHPKRLKSIYKYSNNQIVSTKKYNYKGKLYMWESDTFSNNIAGKYYSKGRLTKTITNLDSLNGDYTIRYNKQGQVYMKFYKIHGYTSSKLYKDLRWVHFKGYISRYNANDAIALEHYFDNGQLRISYDLRKDTLTKPVLVYNKEGTLIRTYQLDSNNSDFIVSKRFDKKTGLLTKKDISYKGGDEMMYIRYDKNRDTAYFSAAPHYLSSIYPNKSGFHLCKKYGSKKQKTENYNLLHTDLGFKNIWIKGAPQTTFHYNDDRFEPDTKYEVIVTQHDKKGTIAIEHKTSHYKITKKDLLTNYSLLNESISYVDPGVIDELKDTLTHHLLFLKRPFTGDLYVKGRYKYKDFDFKTKTKVRTYNVNGYKMKDTSLMIRMFDRGNYSTNELNYANGVPYKIEHGYYESAHYSKGLKDGEGDDQNGFDGHYENGKRHGLYKNHLYYREYYKGLQHGLEMHLGYYGKDKRYDDQIGYKTTFILDTLHGLYQSYVAPEVVGQSVMFEKGYPNGLYFRGNLTCPTSVSVQLDHGYLIDTGYYYFKEGILKAKVNYQLADSVFYGNGRLPVTGSSGRYSLSRDNYYSETENLLLDNSAIISFRSYRTGDYQYFYKNGQLASQGRIKNSQKVGTWKNWDLNGQLYKEISYDTGVYVNPITSDTLLYFGKVTMWYPSGKKLLTGLIKENSFRFKCDQEMEVNFESLHYLTFYDEKGNQIINNGSGRVTEYHNNGEKRLEGELKNNKPFGLWKYYDPNGRLEKMGSFNYNGEKTGMWIEGDLEAVPYYEKFCRAGAVDAVKFPDIDQVGYVTQKINITQYNYQDGILQYEENTLLLPLY